MSREFHVACAEGDADFVERSLRRDSRLAVKPCGPDKLLPLIHACFSESLRGNPRRALGFLRVVKLLLEHGADPNTVHLCGPKMHPWRLSVLYAAAGRANHAGLTMMLLEAGANPNDNESLYHSAEFNDHTCTKLLLDYGAKIEGTNAVHRKLDYDDLAGLRLFLDRGADPNLGNCSGDGLIHWAITNGRRVPFLALLAERGANLRARNREGLTPFQQASRLGHTSAAKFLLRRRAGKRLTPREEFIAACSRGDRRRVKAILAKRPGTIASLTEADRGLLPSLAWRGKGKAVKVMLEAGFDVTAKGKDGETALHCAAWMGHSGIAEILIADGAPLECLEPKYNATPMEWALHGSVNSRDAIGNPLARHADHAGVVRALLNAGARPPASVDDNVPKAVKAVLLRH